MSEFNRKFGIVLSPKYFLDDRMTEDEYEMSKEELQTRTDRIGGYHIEPEGYGTGMVKRCGGGFDWNLVGVDGKPFSEVEGIQCVQLMRLWTTQMFVQIAQGKAYTNETEAGVDVILNEEEREQLKNITIKVYESLHNELRKTTETFTVKRKPKFDFDDKTSNNN